MQHIRKLMGLVTALGLLQHVLSLVSAKLKLPIYGEFKGGVMLCGEPQSISSWDSRSIRPSM